MERDKILMSQTDLKRWHLLSSVLERKFTLKEATPALGVSYRQAKRLKKAVAREGPKALIHKNRGRFPANRLPAGLCARVLELVTTTYGQFNDTHCAEMLARREGITLSRETIRRMRRAQGIKPKRKRRPRQHYKRRIRKELTGMMLLWDGSPHLWFGPSTDPCCLMAAIDDADGQVLHAFFDPSETTLAYLKLLQGIIPRYGIPASIYMDRHSALFRTDDHWSLEEQLQNHQNPTQVGMALADLGIEAIPAFSPQAKGRVERAFGTLQDRLMAELDLMKIRTIEDANRFLPSFLQHYNQRFGKTPAQSGSAFRRLPKNLDLEAILSIRYPATVGNDNTIRLGGIVLDLPPGPKNRSWAKCRVEARQTLDGSWRVFYQNARIASFLPTPLREPARVRRANARTKGAPIENWHYPAQTTLSEGTFSRCT